MFPNLDAEQARHRMTNQIIADKIGISRTSYEKKKKTGKFIVPEVIALCGIFDSNFDYLFKWEDTAA